jgi:L-aspartate semialdehyde sulfurtransferase ferredoxin
MKKQFYLNFPRELVNEPILYQVGHKFKIVTNIKGASISDGAGLLAIELVGEKEEIEHAIKWLEGKGIKSQEMKE